MNVLSLFDGMSCGQIALDQLDFNVDNYYAAEIDKWAIQVAKKNYPNTKHLGDVTELKGSDLPKIDLLMGGSPCQGFSFAGKQLNFDDPRSALFFEFVKYFMLENVRMKQEYQDIISEHLGVKPIMINSALLSAQNRVRLYWTNIPGITQPEDRGIVLKDILDDGVVYARHLKQKPELQKSDTITNIKKGTSGYSWFMEQQTYAYESKKTRALKAGGGSGNIPKVLRPCELKEFNPDSTCHHAATATDIKGNESIKRVYADSGKSPTLTTMGGGHREPKVLIEPLPPTYRKLTPLECERLQTVPDNYTDCVSNSQRYKMLGNGWTVDVIKHILRNIE